MRTLFFFVLLVLLGLACMLGPYFYLSSKEGVEKNYIIEVKAETETAEGKRISFNLLTCRLVGRKAVNLVFIGDKELTEGYPDLYVDASNLRGGNLTLTCYWNREDMLRNDIKNVMKWDLWYGKMKVADAEKYDLEKFDVPINITKLESAYLALKSRNKTDMLEAETREGRKIVLYISDNNVSIQYLNDSREYNALKGTLDSYWRWGLCGKDSLAGNLTGMVPGALARNFVLGGDIEILRLKTRDLIDKVLRGEMKFEESVKDYSNMVFWSTVCSWLVNVLIAATVISFFHWVYRRTL